MCTTVSSNEIRALWHHFKAINNDSEKIDREQFQVAMLFKDSALLDRMFRVFDQDDDNIICFDEYINCLSIISSKASKEDKMKCEFNYITLLWVTPHTYKTLYIVLSDMIFYTHSLLSYPIVSFQIYDFDCDGLISVGDLTAVVAASLREHGVVISRAELDKIVLHTMNEASPKVAGMISYEEYTKMISQKPHMLSHLTLNISRLVYDLFIYNTVCIF